GPRAFPMGRPASPALWILAGGAESDPGPKQFTTRRVGEHRQLAATLAVPFSGSANVPSAVQRLRGRGFGGLAGRPFLARPPTPQGEPLVLAISTTGWGLIIVGLPVAFVALILYFLAR